MPFIVDYGLIEEYGCEEYAVRDCILSWGAVSERKGARDGRDMEPGPVFCV
jgi:hypothetical protein